MTPRICDCVICGEPFEKRPPRLNLKTCSPECVAILRDRTKREAVKRYMPRNTVNGRLWRRENRAARLEHERRYRAKRKANAAPAPE